MTSEEYGYRPSDQVESPDGAYPPGAYPQAGFPPAAFQQDARPQADGGGQTDGYPGTPFSAFGPPAAPAGPPGAGAAPSGGFVVPGESAGPGTSGGAATGGFRAFPQPQEAAGPQAPPTLGPPAGAYRATAAVPVPVAGPSIHDAPYPQPAVGRPEQEGDAPTAGPPGGFGVTGRASVSMPTAQPPAGYPIPPQTSPPGEPGAGGPLSPSSEVGGYRQPPQPGPLGGYGDLPGQHGGFGETVGYQTPSYPPPGNAGPGSYSPGGMTEGYPTGEPDGYPAFGAGQVSAPPTWQTGVPGSPGEFDGGFGGGNYPPTGLGPVESDGASGQKRRKGLVIGLAIAVLVVLGAGGVGAVMFMNSGDGFDVGSCVKKSGDSAVSVECSEKNAFKIVRRVDDQANCPDQAHPFVVIQRDGGKDDVFCLRPAEAN